jgi:hypothetical protein
MTALPELFILYNRTRKSSDPYCGLAYVKATVNPSEGTFTALEVLPTQIGTFLISQKPTGSGTKQYFGNIQLKTYAPTTHPYKVIMDWSSQFNIRTAPGMPIIPVLEIVTRPREHFQKMVKRNLTFQLAEATASASASASAGAGTAGAGTVSIDSVPLPSNLEAVTPAQHQKKVIKIKQNVMNLYVARQLFELARLKKDLCPITAEEFIAGETGVMPCGHLFMKIGIEESFKSRSGQCPLCREAGFPTYV